MLENTRIHQLYHESFKPPERWLEWMKSYEALLARVRELPDAELRSPSVQEELWRARAITGVGPGEAVDVKGAYTDPDFVEAVVALRARAWPEDARSRAAAIQAEFDRLLELLIARRHARVRPHARLARLFAALLPSEMHCAFQGAAVRHLRLSLLTEKNPEGVIAEHVLVRARLRDVLGPELSLAESVQRSIFCWWLHEQHAALVAGTEPTVVGPSGDAEPASLTLWPFNKQSKGLAAFSRNSEAFRDVVRKTLPGVDRQELVEALGTEPNFSKLATNSRRSLISIVKSVGLIEERSQLLFPTEAGEDLLESEEPGALVELLLVRYFPFAHLLRLLTDGPLPSNELYAKLQALYPRWTTTLAPAQALSWVKDLGLVESREGRNVLTPYGKAWHERLPADLPSPSAQEKALADFVVGAANDISPGEAERARPDLETMLRLFREDTEASKLYFSDSQRAALHTAWHCLPGKHFVILSGLSGTGKTAIVQHYARLYLQAMGLVPEEHTELVAVAPDWRDPSGLLGYLNPLHEEPTFQLQPALKLLLRAAEAGHLPYFLILDEMNLASVERYFASFLSAMESQRNAAGQKGKLTLHGGSTEVNGVPPEIDWPQNFFIAGTINMDETTHPLSDKVLDRAFTLEFWDVDLKGHFERRHQRDHELEQLLLDLHAILSPVRRHFGYRTANEVLAFVAAAGEFQRQEMVDQAVFSKVLPRLRGEDGPPLRKALEDAALRCAAGGLERSASKLRAMKLQLEATGLTRFWS